MRNWKYFKPYEIIPAEDKKIVYDDNIYTFDIETSSYLYSGGSFYPASEYKNLRSRKEDLAYYSSMYIWMFGINDCVYYGRTWDEFYNFLCKILDHDSKTRKIVYVHNLSFEFQFMFPHFEVDKVFARKSRRVIGFLIPDFNLEFRCSLMLTNVKLALLPSIYGLKTKKLEGDLDYSKIRNSKTKLTKKEMKYCENDCLVLYECIFFFRSQYWHVFQIPKTSTGIVRKEFKDLVEGNKGYYSRVRKAYNSDPHIYNLMVQAFAGGYTHANVIYADEILSDVTSFDEASAYPYHMVARRYPSTRFQKANVKQYSDLLEDFAYLLVVKFKNIESKFYNHFISYSKCKDVLKPIIDNGRLVSAEELTIVCTDVDLGVYLDAYNVGEYEIQESYKSVYKYLPIELVNFILDKYKGKTSLKGVDPIKYALEKGKFNSIFGMCVTNTIRAEAVFNGSGWNEDRELTNEEIVAKLKKEFNYSFLSFSWGVWITSWSRKTLLDRIMENDEYNAYSDTDSLKLLKGFNREAISSYNNSVVETIKRICEIRKIHIDRFQPADPKGKKHLLGLFEEEETYKYFKTLGAKKYCCVDPDGKISITVAGVPKSGAKILSSIKDFKKDLVFPAELTGKIALLYNDNIPEHEITDYQGNTAYVPAGSGVTMIGDDYTLGMKPDYESLMQSSKRSLYKE